MRRLLCISERRRDTEVWRCAIGLEHADVLHHSPCMPANRLRGLGEPAIVWINNDSSIPLGIDHIRILEMYIAMGAPEFFGYEYDKITRWLQGGTWAELRAQRKAFREWSRSG